MRSSPRRVPLSKIIFERLTAPALERLTHEMQNARVDITTNTSPVSKKAANTDAYTFTVCIYLTDYLEHHQIQTLAQSILGNGNYRVCAIFGDTGLASPSWCVTALMTHSAKPDIDGHWITEPETPKKYNHH